MKLYSIEDGKEVFLRCTEERKDELYNIYSNMLSAYKVCFIVTLDVPDRVAHRFISSADKWNEVKSAVFELKYWIGVE